MQLIPNKITYILIIFFVLVSCHKSDEKSKEVFKKKEVFHYREIVIDSVRDYHTYKRKYGLNCLFGKWIITSIADVGGTMINENKIQSQIGKKLVINETNFEVDFLGSIFKTKHPSYSIVSDKGTKGTSLWYGYLSSSRDSVFNLIVENEKKESYFYIELISCKEIATYYDGRIYFYAKQSK